MSDEKDTKVNNAPNTAPKAEGTSTTQASKSGPARTNGKRRSVSFVGKDGKGPRRRPRKERGAGEPEQKIIDIRRVTRVTSGGRRFSFSVAIVVGDRNGRVGVGLGKGGDTAAAIDKAVKKGKKSMIKIPLTKNRSINKPVEAKYCSARVYIQPAKGKGLVAGSALRSVLDLAGITDVNAKIISRSKNKLNISRATVMALKKVR